MWFWRRRWTVNNNDNNNNDTLGKFNKSSTERVPANALLQNNSLDVIFYCPLGWRSRTLALLYAAFVFHFSAAQEQNTHVHGVITGFDSFWYLCHSNAASAYYFFLVWKNYPIARNTLSVACSCLNWSILIKSFVMWWRKSTFTDK